MNANVLILDDSPTFLIVAQQYLMNKDYEVFTAKNQEEALETLEREDIDLLALDWEMPGGESGLDLVQGLRSGWKYFDLPIVLMTGRTEYEDIIAAMNAGCDDFVSKEEGVEVLEVRIQRLLFFLQRLNIVKSSRKERHILLVDDSPTFLRSTQKFLESCHFQVSAASSGEEALETLGTLLSTAESGQKALEILKQEGIDLMVVDWMMPEMDGLELIRQVRSNNLYREIPIIMLSGKDRLEDITTAIEIGADDFINKDSDLHLLEKKLGVLLRIQEQYRRYTHQIFQEKQKVEELVRIRTQELLKTNQELKDTQTQLVQAEKMASLGQLVAGVAHEINNPLSFIQNNLYTIREDVEALKELMTRYRQYCQGSPDPKAWEAIQTMEEEIDLDYTHQELEEFLSNSENGAIRIKDIVKSLRNFSRLDEGEIKKADLYEGIDNALLILNHQYKDRIEIIKEWEPLPEIECAPGQLNQVFMNLITNAIQAIEGKGTVTLRGRVEEHQIVLEFADTGCGISSENLSKLFDPFFTTKPVGEGTGLGLSIVYRIIESHQGQINIRSETGKGSLFTIQLPLDREMENSSIH